MRQDNNSGAAGQRQDEQDLGQQDTLEWLLEQEYNEPTEQLFTLSEEEKKELNLTALEQELAARPMSSGDRNLDDLSSFVSEEIILADTGSASDIYAQMSSDPLQSALEAPLAVDFSRVWQQVEPLADASLADGTDILGLSECDDIGEQFLVIRKPAAESGGGAESGAVASGAAASGAAAEKAPASDVVAVQPVTEPATAPVTEQAPPATTAEDVYDFVAGSELPRDDEAFDRYLLQGGKLQSGAHDIDALVVESLAGVTSVDPDTAESIDYHEDFALASHSQPPAALLVARLMAELYDAVQASLASLGLPGETLDIQMLSATDAQSQQRLAEQGYVPLGQIGMELAALAGESLVDVAAQTWVRLAHLDSGDSWNLLLHDGFAIPGQLSTLAAATAASFDDLELEFEALAAATDWPAIEESDSAGLSLQADAATQLDPLGAIDELDSFDLELDTALDVDALLDSLAEPLLESDDICGIAVDEFAVADELEPVMESVAADPEPEVAVTDSLCYSDPAAAAVDMAWCIPEHINFNRSVASGTEIFADFLDAFIEEAASELEKLEDSMSAWEENIASEAAFAPVPRILHTLKGIAKGVGLQYYGTLMHNFENLLEGMARPEPGQESGYFHIVNAWLDAAVRGFEHVRDARADILSEFPQRSAAPVEIAQAAVTAAPAPALAEPAVAVVDEVELPSLSVSGVNQRLGTQRQQSDKQLADEGAKVLAAQQSIRMTPESLDHLLNLTNQTQQLGVRASQATLRSKGSASELQGRLTSVRSHIAKIADRALANVTARGGQLGSAMDALEMDQYSELQEAANILREGVEDLDDLINLTSKQNAQIEALLKQQASVVSFLGSSIQAARIVPVSRLMPSLRRIVRTVSSDLGKAVQFRVLSEVGSLDRDNHARCQIVLEHMVRNALDHGIESPTERIAAGKPTAGQITIEVSKDGGDYVIELADDGRGIDPDVMRETAFDKGLDIDVDALSDAEAQRLIFHKGFSTADTVSEISGRGVGMEIVLSELQHIGGDIDIQSEVDRGTTFRVRIPSNVTLNGALLVSAGKVSYAIPLAGLIAVEQVARDDFYDAVENNGRLNLFGMECEPSYLATLCHGEGLPERAACGSTVPVIIAGTDERRLAIAVDDVKQALELVIRSLGQQFSAVPGVTGAATTADGQAIVALDLNTLVAQLLPEQQQALSVEKVDQERMLVLVVDDSRTQRLVATSRFDSLGVETVTAENGQVAMEFLNNTHRIPDVVLLDVEMPVKDGIQTLRDIRQSSRLRDLPVIMVTSRTGSKHRALAEEAGCNGYMGKPFNFPVLIEMIAEQTGRALQLM